MIRCYTDGACTLNKVNGEYFKGAGGYAYYVVDELNNPLHKFSARKPMTTNNEMELLAILSGLQYCVNLPSKDIEIYSDSAYCINTFTNWIFSWEKNDWTRGKRKEERTN